MLTLIKKELRLSRRLLILWAGVDILLCCFSYFEYLSLKDNMQELAALVDSFPRILKVMFGCTGDLKTTIGWFGCIWFWLAIMDFSYAVFLGITCVAKEGKQGTAEYLFTLPIARDKIILAKALASLVDLLILALISGISNYLTGALPLGGLGDKKVFIATTLGIFFTEALLFAAALLLSALAGSVSRGTQLGAAFLIACYGAYIVTDEAYLPVLRPLALLRYFEVLAVAENGLSPLLLVICALLTSLCILLASRIWPRRELT